MSDNDTTKSNSASSSDDDNESHGDEQQVAGSTSLYYSSHISAVCESMNATTRKRARPQTSGMTKQEKRREANRLSARRCRKRRKVELEEAEDEIRRLTSESSQLAEANAALRNELQEEVAKVMSDNPTNGNAIATASTLRDVVPRVREDPALIALLRQQNQPCLPSGNRVSDHLQANQGMPSLLSSSSGIPGYGLMGPLNPSNLSSLASDNRVSQSGLGPSFDPSTVALLQMRQLLNQANQARVPPHGSLLGLPTNLLGVLPPPSNQCGNVFPSILAHAHSGAPSPMAAGCNPWLPHASFPGQLAAFGGRHQPMVGTAASSSDESF